MKGKPTATIATTIVATIGATTATRNEAKHLHNCRFSVNN